MGNCSPVGPAKGAAKYIALVPLICLLLPASAAAKSTRDLNYGYAAVWTTAIRFLRADRDYKITDRDKEAGYILFVYPGSGSVKECHASLEIVSTVDQNDYVVTRLLLKIAHQPSYVELHLLDRLERKLVDERGEAAPRQRRKTKKPPEKPKDKAKDKSKGTGPRR
jgi:hypothetical protein